MAGKELKGLIELGWFGAMPCTACGGTGADRNHPRSLQGCAVCGGDGQITEIVKPKPRRKS